LAEFDAAMVMELNRFPLAVTERKTDSAANPKIVCFALPLGALIGRRGRYVNRRLFSGLVAAGRSLPL